MVNIQIKRKEGFVLNPDDKVVNSLFRMIGKNKGICPCTGNTSTDKHCPCTNYLEKDICCCGLYKKIDTQ